MGRTVPTYRNAIERELEKWKEFRKALRRRERKSFDKIIDSCKCHISASSQSKRPEPFRAMVMSVLLEQQVEIDSLKKELKRLRDRLGDE